MISLPDFSNKILFPNSDLALNRNDVNNLKRSTTYTRSLNKASSGVSNLDNRKMERKENVPVKMKQQAITSQGKCWFFSVLI